MRKNFGAKPWTYPQPVFIIGTYDENGKPNAMNAAWGGICEDTRLMLCLSADHRTTLNLVARGAFTVSMADEAHMAACDYVGIASGNDTPDKMEKAGFTTEKAEHVDAPLICELPMTLECTVVSYDKESCCLIGEIVNISADESILDEAGKIDPDKLKPITFDPVQLTYRALGPVAGKAFGAGLALK